MSSSKVFSEGRNGVAADRLLFLVRRYSEENDSNDRMEKAARIVLQENDWMTMPPIPALIPCPKNMIPKNRLTNLGRISLS